MNSFFLSCPNCGTANRVPGDKEGVAGTCGSCHGALPPLYWQPRQLSQSSFDDFSASYPGPLLAEFWAPW
jgi:thioredoxin 2